ncbi:Hypothetical predicted protein [Paramuricea clavata]|uniref:Uncharacterized protein n=1 Tax=Paramuricea clavata TaxID=317549 RepID=A0A6S7JGU3_PARCT|nr:Hypothetical predicted protein [Paramuricea clavata]
MDRSNEQGAKSKANDLPGLIMRSTLEMTDIKARKYLYLKLVRSNLAYASQVLCPQSVQLIQNIEKMQRGASTRFIINLGFVTNIPYPSRLHNLYLLPITYWHEYLDIFILYKIINNILTTVLGWLYLDQESLEVKPTTIELN